MANEDKELELAEAFGEIARALLNEHELQPTLEMIVHVAIDLIDVCEHAGITLIEGRKVSSPAPSDEIPRLIDHLQEDTNQGPCLDAIREHEVFRTGSLAGESRWPEFSHRAHAETGIQSVLSMRLFADQDTMGALNLYSTERDAFDDRDIAVASVLAAHAAVAMVRAREVHSLETAVENRDVIGQAKGIIIAATDCSPDEAFERLKQQSQHENIKLRVLADEIVRRSQHRPSRPGN